LKSITKINSFIRLAFSLISSLIFAASAFANELTSDFSSELSLQGAAIYQELGKDYYIASLHLANKVPSAESSPAVMLDYKGEQRLQI
jgi:hypothetical protein